MSNTSQKLVLRTRRKMRIRKKITGTVARPRLSVFRSDRHVYAQIIDDTMGHTLASASTLEREVGDQCVGLKRTEAARIVGRVVAQRALASGVAQVVFDRGGYQYHGRVKALAEGAREAGLHF